ncbi:hypothetical protein W97_01422 [Coniosporium apollinis CBS 100218]|uniref:Glycosyl hydrolase family 13 catalytic domain-containing protein n=1 Tax=Coniosporium apollinis (strain CBS 100218) TaxID=1168221 RepID=R7YJV4_CONA1|nr:uncharacterized protein W97_01422 [Coniosporium apollinis CBS 100218]EON62202.1 hypothetical protein W97_01422 [Coniosporium apollinis CBS 100218]
MGDIGSDASQIDRGNQGNNKPTPENQTLLQGFEWNVPDDFKQWTRLHDALPVLQSIGVTNLWLPPGCKASSPKGNGYDIYDLYDLGEFDQKGGKPTKFGSKEDLDKLASRAQELGVGLYWDAVLNHKAAADSIEKCMVVDVDEQDRAKEIGEPHEIEAWLGFEFKGRGDKYSKQKYHWYHFSGTDWDQKTEKKAIYKILGDNKGWSRSVGKEDGNADYLMFADVDYSHPEVEEDVKQWGAWITKEVKLKGFRLDAVQHISGRYMCEWAKYIWEQCGKDVFFVGEFWVGDADELNKWIKETEGIFSLYDAPLLNNFSSLSQTEAGDLRQVFDGSLVKVNPDKAVTVVMNHDTQPGQTVETPVEAFFKPLAYALILLRQEGYPCAFYGDLYGLRANPDDDDVKPQPPACSGKLADLLRARKLFAYGEQDDYFDAENCVGWVRRGTWDRPGCAVVMSNAAENEKRMFVGEDRAGEVWVDVLGWAEGEVEIDGEGFGMFTCPGVSVAVWVHKEVEGREKFPVNFDADIYGEGE